nr:hypothetical protein CFP56_23199 [Quercus suber]
MIFEEIRRVGLQLRWFNELFMQPMFNHKDLEWFLSAGRTSVVCKEFWRTALKVVAAGLPRIIDHFTIIGTLIKDQSFGLYK